MVTVAMERRAWAAAAVLLISGCAADHRGQRVTVSARSPQELLQVFDKAVREGDDATAVACIDPSHRWIVAKAATAKAAFDRHSSQLEALLVERSAGDTAQLIAAREEVWAIFAGVLSWRWPAGDLEVVTEDGRAVLLRQGRPTGLVLRNVGRRWYLRYARPAARKEECEYFALTLAQQSRKLRLLAKGIRAGKLSEEDVKAVLSGQQVLPGERSKRPQGRTRIQKERIGD